MDPYTKYNKSKLRRNIGGTRSTRNNRIKDTKITRSTRSNIFKKIVKSTVKPPMPTFLGTQGEDNLEANLSFLIELMGGSIFDTYVNDILNEKIKKQNGKEIEIMNIDKPMNPGISLLQKGNPIIFYGKKNGTHFTSTFGDGKLIDSYSTGVQKNGTDHFCQTFSLMVIEHHFFPNSFIGKRYTNLSFSGTTNGYIDNVMIAIQAACYVIGEVNKQFDISNYINDAVSAREPRNNQLSHRTNVEERNIVNSLIKYCKSITKEDLFNSTFIQKIFNLSSPNEAKKFRIDNQLIIQ